MDFLQLLEASLPADRLALVRTAGQIAQGEGVPLYLVGGAVRDLLLGRLMEDLDLVVEGDAETLRALGAELGFEVDVVGPVGPGEDPISSTGIRRALLEGDTISAAEALGRPYSIRGLVVRGDQRGRTLGFPTANLEVRGGGAGQKLIPPPGIYAVRGILKSGTYDGALHLGPRPTFRGSPPTIEVYLMDFDREIYGEEIRVDFVRYLREIQPFDSQRALVDQMREDVEEARTILANA